MGNIFKCWFALFAKDDVILNISLIGLDNAGKTTLLTLLKTKKIVDTIPTVSINTEMVSVGKHNLLIWDVGGQQALRPIWKHYMEQMDGCIYMVDSSDLDRLELASQELQKYIALTRRGIGFVLLVLFNKTDQQKRELTEKEKSMFMPPPLILEHVTYKAECCSVLKENNIQEPLLWFSSQFY
jgi:small GTP-binding protein